jgi:Holliday junction resolvase RusA-like endonuclease
VNDAVLQAMRESGDLNQFDQAVKVEAVFYLTKPRTVKRDYPITPPDLDKLARGLLDGMKPCWKDDSLVVRLEISKKYAVGQTGVAVTVTHFP